MERLRTIVSISPYASHLRTFPKDLGIIIDAFKLLGIELLGCTLEIQKQCNYNALIPVVFAGLLRNVEYLKLLIALRANPACWHQKYCHCANKYASTS